MRQRAMIALALACDPDVIVADEPTTALDVMVQAQILELLGGIARDFGMGIILVTHDLGVVAQVCDRVVVMYGGVIAEENDAATLYREPQHPYTQQLLGRSRTSRIPTGPSAASRDAAPTRRHAGGLPLRAAMPPGVRALPRRASTRIPRRRRPGIVLPPRPGRSADDRAAAGRREDRHAAERRGPRARSSPVSSRWSTGSRAGRRPGACRRRHQLRAASRRGDRPRRRVRLR